MNKSLKIDTAQKGKLYFLVLSVLSGIMLGLSFPPSPFYSLAYVAFVPFLYVFVMLESNLRMMKYSYLFLLIFQIMTIYWTGGFTVGKDVWMMSAGAGVIVIHPLFYLPFIMLAFIIKKKLGINYGLLALSFLWVSFEYLHSLGEYSFPWLTIGNSQAYDINRIQLIEYISVYGLSLIILFFNSIAFILLYNSGKPHLNFRSARVMGLLLVLIFIYFGTDIYGRMTVKNEQYDSGTELDVGVVQPNFDPWEKWGGKSGDKYTSYLDQFNKYIYETKMLAGKNPDIIIWPETAIPFYILSPRYYENLSGLFSLVDTLNIPIFTGLPVAEYFDSLNAPATAQNVGIPRLYVETYNSAVLIKKGRNLGEIHKKTILVPFAERIPYAETFRFLVEPLKWNVGISGWGKGADTVVNNVMLEKSDSVKFSGMICYESVYPDYVREFVKRGAQFLVIITNDSWWGNTSGAYQHAAYASLRAVETRRWIVQCANGGISMIIDPTGKIRFKTNLYTQTRFIGKVVLRSDETFYMIHGDIVGKICLMISVAVIIASIFIGRKSK